MAHGLSLTLRRIQPHPRPAGAPAPNEHRRAARAGAKAARVTVRRFKRQQRAIERAGS